MQSLPNYQQHFSQNCKNNFFLSYRETPQNPNSQTNIKKENSWRDQFPVFSSVQFSSVPQLCPTICDPMNSSMPGFPDHHQLLKSTQTDVHRVGDAIQPSDPLLSASPPALNFSQHQGFFK